MIYVPRSRQAGESPQASQSQTILRTQKKDKYRRKGKGRRCYLGGRFIQFLAALATVYFAQDYIEEKDELHQDDQKEKDCLSSYISNRLVQNSQLGKELNKFFPPNSSDKNLRLFFSLYPSSLPSAQLGQGNIVIGHIEPVERVLEDPLDLNPLLVGGVHPKGGESHLIAAPGYQPLGRSEFAIFFYRSGIFL